jgi:YggT family protein
MGALYSIIDGILDLYGLLIAIRCVLSWIPMRPNAVSRWITEVTEPYLGLFRRLLGRFHAIAIDFAPLLGLLALFLARRLVRVLFGFLV